jgi:glyoxylase-like metal-dependent hydrolase (beta-lactamase superfamily II)
LLVKRRQQQKSRIRSSGHSAQREKRHPSLAHHWIRAGSSLPNNPTTRVVAAPPDHPQSASPPTATDTRLASDVTGFYDAATGSIQYVVADPLTRSCAVIDPVLDFDPRSGSTATTSADRLLKHIEAQGLTLEWVLDTHPHADHFSAAGYLKDMTGASTGIGERVVEVSEAMESNLQFTGQRPGRRVAVGSVVCRWRAIHSR